MQEVVYAWSKLHTRKQLVCDLWYLNWKSMDIYSPHLEKYGIVLMLWLSEIYPYMTKILAFP